MAKKRKSPDVPNELKTDSGASKDKNAKSSKVVSLKQKAQALKNWALSHKRISVPVALLLFVCLQLAIPFTRYALLGQIVKKNASVRVIDSKTGAPVSDATVTIGNSSAKTDSDGKALLRRVAVGNHAALISKKYYQAQSVQVKVPVLFKSSQTKAVLFATGRQTLVVVSNKITGEPLVNVSLKVLGTTAKTDKTGTATVVVPANTKTVNVVVQHEGYNELNSPLLVSDDEVERNDITLTPVGRILFLSNRAGTLDVMRANLDGSDVQVVVKGTGSENSYGTTLLANKDWSYAILQSRREGDSAKLYLVHPGAEPALSLVDEGDASFTMIGWIDNHFIYQVNRNGKSSWEPKQVALKSFDAESQKITTFDETSAEGGSVYDYASENVSWAVIVNNLVLYHKNWRAQLSYGQDRLAGKSDTTFEYDAGTNTKRSVRHVDIVHPSWRWDYYGAYEYAELVSPSILYIRHNIGTGGLSYTAYSKGKFLEDNIPARDYFEKNQGDRRSFFASPSSAYVLWAEPRDNKVVLFTSIYDNQDKRVEIARLHDYSPYGWFGDDYILLSKEGSELFIMSRSGMADGKLPLKITDFHPSYRYSHGYGGGYGA